MSVIRKYCCIHAGKCFLDGALLFQSEQETAKEFLAELYREIKPEYPKFFKMDVLAKAGFLAAELLMKGTEPEEKD